MKILVAGATGYVGMRASQALLADGHEVHGLARSQESAARLKTSGITPIDSNAAGISRTPALLKPFDAIVIALAKLPFSDERGFVQAIIDAFRSDGRTLIYTSGTGVVAIDARKGQWDEHAFAEDDPFPFPTLEIRAERLPTENCVREASRGGFKTMVIRAPLVFGHGKSDHVPNFFRSARTAGRVAYLGHGLNVISNVHVDDLARLYSLALQKGRAGALYHAVAGESNFRTIAEAVAEVIGCEADSLDFDDLCKVRHPNWVRLGLALNSRTKAARSRAELGWTPQFVDIINDIRNGSYRDAYRNGAL